MHFPGTGPGGAPAPNQPTAASVVQGACVRAAVVFLLMLPSRVFSEVAMGDCGARGRPSFLSFASLMDRARTHTPHRHGRRRGRAVAIHRGAATPRAAAVMGPQAGTDRGASQAMAVGGANAVRCGRCARAYGARGARGEGVWGVLLVWWRGGRIVHFLVS